MKDIDRTAPVIVELQTTIAATPETLWQLHTDIDSWPNWNAGIDKALLRGGFVEGSVFEWETAGLSISSSIVEVLPQRRTVWGGPAHGIDGVHVWMFEPTADGTVVTTLESWAGAPVEADPEGMRAALEGSLLAWLDALKGAAERGRG
ncbi:SRPBCC family protein [Streptomyces himalayensis]|uniref:SRPBCC family protein n=1 Tax=Streptomyces himalayensis TaxID=2820085 RepID=UPI001C6A369E|nr:SRPBCC family protein [Streptomyces himalayensis]